MTGTLPKTAGRLPSSNAQDDFAGPSQRLRDRDVVAISPEDRHVGHARVAVDILDRVHCNVDVGAVFPMHADGEQVHQLDRVLEQHGLVFREATPVCIGAVHAQVPGRSQVVDHPLDAEDRLLRLPAAVVVYTAAILRIQLRRVHIFEIPLHCEFIFRDICHALPFVQV